MYQAPHAWLLQVSCPVTTSVLKSYVVTQEKGELAGLPCLFNKSCLTCMRLQRRTKWRSQVQDSVPN